MAELNERLTPEQPDGASLVRNLQVRFNHNPSAGEPGPHVATLSVDLLTAERRTVDLETLTAAWREAIGPIAGVHSLVIQEPGFGPAGTPIEVRLSGDDLDELQQASEHLKETLGTYQGVYNVLHDLRPGKPQYQFRMAEGAHGLGLTAEATARQLRAAILGELGAHCASAPTMWKSWSATPSGTATAWMHWRSSPCSGRTANAYRWRWRRNVRQPASGRALPGWTANAQSPWRPT